MQDLSIGASTVKIGGPLIPSSQRSPVNFLQPPKVVKPLENGNGKLITVKSAQSMGQSSHTNFKSPNQ